MRMDVEFGGGQRVLARYGNFVIETDQPPDHGGDGSAPAPFDLFIASLGTCAGFYVLSFLERRGLPLDQTRVVVTTTRDPERGRLARIELKVIVPESFPERYLPALARAVDQCTVKRHVLDPPEFDTVVELVAAPAAA